MLNQETLYLDTSVASARFDDRCPERMALTQRFWVETLPQYEVCISEVVIAEALRTPDGARRQEIVDHMVQVKTKRRLPVLAAEHGYFKHPMIVSPQEFLLEKPDA